ncbi:MAG: AI-2E family transporter [Anaerolineae bacterium]|nr:AI-2E family transporter [Anaerolineae bacterium]
MSDQPSSPPQKDSPVPGPADAPADPGKETVIAQSSSDPRWAEALRAPAQAPYRTSYQPQWSTWARQLATVLLIIGGLYALTLLAPVMQMLALSFLIAFLLFGPSRSLARHTPIPYAGAVLALYVLLIVAVLFLVLIFIPAFVNGVNGLVERVEATYADLQIRLSEYGPEQGIVTILGTEVDFNFIIEPLRDFLLGTGPLAADLVDTAGAVGASGEPSAFSTPPPGALATPGATPATGDVAPADTGGAVSVPTIDLQQLIASIASIAGAVTGTVTSAITSVTGLLITLLMALFLSFLILIDMPDAQVAFVRYTPPAYHREMALLIAKIVEVWNAFFRGQVIIGIIIGLVTWLQLALMGVAGAEILAVFTGIISLIPTIGGIIALIPLGIVPLVEGSLVFTEMSPVLFTLLVVGINLIVSQIVWNVLAPKIQGDALKLPMAVIIVGVFIGAAVGGVLGAFLVAPIMATIRVSTVYVLAKIGGRDPYPGEEAPRALREGLFASAGRPHFMRGEPEDDAEEVEDADTAPRPATEAGT